MDLPLTGSEFVLIVNLFYITLLAILYFSKARMNNLENKIFKYLIISNTIGIILDLIISFTIQYYRIIPSVNLFFQKFYLEYLSFWTLTLTIYVIIISFKNGTDEEFKKTKIYFLLKKFYIYMLLVTTILIIILPLEFYYSEKEMYSFGPAATWSYAFGGICILVSIVCLLLNIKKIKAIKALPLIVYLVLFPVVILIQVLYPNVLLVTATESFVTFLMYFTIENPDMKMINELNIAKDQAIKANAAKTDFLSSMSHEIRTPLNAIVGFSESLKEEQLSSEAKEEVGDIIDASSTLLEIVNGILDISKIEANKIEIVNSNYHFNKIFNELIALSKARLGDSKPIEFKYKMDESIPGTLYGDYARIKQVILNLLTNSIKYTDSGYIDFQVNSIINDNVCRLIVSVEDSGKGIKKESINKLFTKFERLDEKNTTIEGTGLGLAITKKLVELMNGKIVVQSIYGKGSKFTVIIDQRIIANEDNNIEEEKEEETNVIKQYPNKKLLIVDDNQLNLKVAARLLRSYECQIEEVDSGYKVIDLIASGNKYDLILMDDMMPKLSGIDTLHRLKENPTFNMPVVALTANAISGMRETYLAEGFDEYLAKPIEKNELNEIMIKFLDK